MAPMITRRAISSSSTLLQRLLCPARPLATTSPTIRSFNTQVFQLSRAQTDDEEDNKSEWSETDMGSSNWNVDRRRSLFHYLIDQRTFLKMLKTPFLAMTQGTGLGDWERRVDIREDEDAVYLRVEMPGLGKEDVKVSVDQNSITIRGQGEKESEDDDESGRRFRSRVDLPQELFKLDQIKAEMKNGVLKLSVPKIKEDEEVKDVFNVKIE